MESERLKQEIRRRLFASRREAGRPLAALADRFMSCPRCAGRGKVCIESTDAGVPTALVESCPRCDGDGFVARDVT